MPNKSKYLYILFLLVIFLTGCTRDEVEIDRITSPVAMGIDFDEKSKLIKIYAQISNVSSQVRGEAQSAKTYKVIEGQGETLLMAMTDAIDHSQQNLAWDHLLIVVFSNKMAEQGISSSMEYLLRLDQLRFNCYLLLTDDNFNDLFASAPLMETGLASPIAGQSLISTLSTHTKTITLKDFVIPYLCKEAAPIIPMVSIYKKEEKMQQKEIELDYQGFGVFRNDRLIGRLDEKETLGMLIISGLKDQGSLIIPDSGGSKDSDITISGLITKPKVIPSLQNMKPSVKVEIEAEYDISQAPVPMKMDIQDIEKMNLKVSAYMKKKAEEVIKKAQLELKADVLGFGAEIYRKYPDYWLKNKDNWIDIFPTINAEAEVTAQLDNTGFSTSTLKYIFGKD